MNQCNIVRQALLTCEPVQRIVDQYLEGKISPNDAAWAVIRARDAINANLAIIELTLDSMTRIHNLETSLNAYERKS